MTDPLVSTPDPTITPEPILPTHPSTKKYFFLSFFITLFCVALLSLALYLYRQNVTLKSELASSPAPVPIASADPTIDWKTITIDELNISFKLPPVIYQDQFRKESTPSDRGSQNCWVLGSPQGSLLVKRVMAGGAPCPLYTFTLAQSSFDHEAGRMSGFSDYKAFQAQSIVSVSDNQVVEKTNQNGVKTIKIIGSDENGFALSGTPGAGVVGALIKTSDPEYPVVTAQMKLSDSLTTEVFDQILSTFKFTETSTAWQSYTNKNVGFSIQYPAGWRMVESDKSVGFGPHEIGEDIVIGAIFYPKEGLLPSDITAKIGSQFSDRVATSDFVIVDKTKVGRIIVTTPSNPDWYSESIIFETSKNYVVVGNGAVKDENLPFNRGIPKDFTFEKFYSTFKFIN